MPAPTGPTNPLMQKFVAEIRSRGYKEKSAFLIKLANELTRSTRRRAEVNIGRLQRTCNAGETIVVPGKLLGIGILDKKLTVAAWNWSPSAKQKIEMAGGKLVMLTDFITAKQKGSGVRVIV